MPEETIRWDLARQFGWTLEYIDGLSLQDINQYTAILTGKSRAGNSKR